jgi:hypothetical protein
MTMYPKPLEQRFAATIQAIQARLTKLESRTGSIDSGYPVAALPAVIDSAYATGDPKAYLNGASTLTGPYQHLASYTPAAGDAVLVAPVGVQRTYIILGKLI